MNSSGRILHQVMRHREQARAVRGEGNTTPSVNSSTGAHSRPESAMSSYDIGVPLRVSEPGSLQPRRRLSSGSSLLNSGGTNSPPPVLTNSQQQPFPSEEEQRSDHGDLAAHGEEVSSFADGAEASRPHSATKRPPSPYRRTPQTNDPIELKRCIAQLQSKLLSSEVQLQQTKAKQKLLVVQLRRYKVRCGGLEDGEADSNPGYTEGLVNHAGGTSDSDTDRPVSATEDSAVASLSHRHPGDEMYAHIEESAVPLDDDLTDADHDTLLELSERGSTHSMSNPIAVQLDHERGQVEAALGGDASKKYVFAVEVRSEEDLKELLLDACGRLTRLRHGSGGVRKQSLFAAASTSRRESTPPTGGPGDDEVYAADAQRRESGWDLIDNARLRRDTILLMTREGKNSSRAMKTLLETLKTEVKHFRDSSAQCMESGVHLCQCLVRQLQLWSEHATALVTDMDHIKSMLLGQPTLAAQKDSRNLHPSGAEPLTLSGIGQRLDHCLDVIKDLSKLSNVTAGAVLVNQGILQSTIEAAAAAATKPAGGESPTRDRPSEGLAAESLLQTLEGCHTNTTRIRADFDAVVRHCEAQQGRILRDRVTEEDLLRIFQEEVVDARRRCRSHMVESGVQTETHLDVSSLRTVHESAVTVPTVSTPTSNTIPLEASLAQPQPAVVPLSRPGSGSVRTKAKRPTSSNSQTTAGGGSSVIPPVIRHLISCVNVLHIAFMEILFGPVHNNSKFRTIEEQQRAFRERVSAENALRAAVTPSLQQQQDPPPRGEEHSPLSSSSSMVLVGRQGKPLALDFLSDESMLRQQIEEHVQVLPQTYGELLKRQSSTVRLFPTQLTSQDESDLAIHTEMAQRLVEVGMLWHQALGPLRVHHASAFLHLVRHSKPMRSAYFFHDASLVIATEQELANSGASFATALRHVFWPDGGPGKMQNNHNKKYNANEILYHIKLLSDANHVHAKLNWRGLMTLHKHVRMRQLIMLALKTLDSGGSGTSTSTAEKLRRIVTAFYADLSIKLETEQRLLKASLQLTVDAIWTDLMSLLQESAQLCFDSGINIDALEFLGPSRSDLLVSSVKQLAEIIEAKSASRGKYWSSVVMPSNTALELTPHPGSGGQERASIILTEPPPNDSSVQSAQDPQPTVSFVSGDSWMGLCISRTSALPPPATTANNPEVGDRSAGNPLSRSSAVVDRAPSGKSGRVSTPSTEKRAPLARQPQPSALRPLRVQHQPASSMDTSASRGEGGFVMASSTKVFSLAAATKDDNPWLQWKMKKGGEGAVSR